MPSSRMTALLGLLAIAGYQNRHRLGEMLGQATGNPSSGAATAHAPSGMASGPQRGGGGLLGALLGGGAQQAGSGGSGAQQAGPSGGLLSGFLGGSGSAGALLS